MTFNYKKMLLTAGIVSGLGIPIYHTSNRENGLEATLRNSPALTARTYDNFENDSDEVLLARLIYGEARGESIWIKRAIADSVINRTGKNKWWGNTLREVILKENQYSCFNKNDPNRIKLLNPTKYDKLRVWEVCLIVAMETLPMDNNDDSNGATHYYDTSIKEPEWARNKKPVKVIKTKNGRKIKFYCLDN